MGPSKQSNSEQGNLAPCVSAHDDYKPMLPAPGQHIVECPVCGAEAGLWQYSTSPTAPTSKAVMCSNGDAFGPQDGVVNEGCLLYMPPQAFYKATAREAIAYWNEYAAALVTQQRARRWQRAKALRKTP